MKTVTATDFKRSFKELANEIIQKGEVFLIPRKKDNKTNNNLVLMSYDEYERLKNNGKKEQPKNVYTREDGVEYHFGKEMMEALNEVEEGKTTRITDFKAYYKKILNED